ncbi:MAG: InlB B-repeat-containing protein, partial [Firmicutes bacterium]|nr:InlB B-repeat-containing protein [Bacillota bacterium]
MKTKKLRRALGIVVAAVMVFAMVPAMAMAEDGGGAIFTEDFEGGVMPEGWTNEGDSTWTVGKGDYNEETGAHSGNYNAKIYIDSSGKSAYIVTRALNLASFAGEQDLQLNFWYINRDWGYDTDGFGVYYRVGNTAWTEIFSTTENHDVWTEKNADIPVEALADNVQFGFKIVADYGYGVGLDDISITVKESEEPATDNEITVADGTDTNGYVPVYGLYADAYVKAQYIVPASDLAVISGKTIKGLKWYANSPASESWGSANFQVYLMEVEGTTINSFADLTNATLVYEGSIDGTKNEVELTFTAPYEYNGGNLLVSVFNTVKGTYKRITFSGVTAEGASVQNYSYNNLDSITPTQRNFIPKTTFVYKEPEEPTPATPVEIAFSVVNIPKAGESVAVREKGNTAEINFTDENYIAVPDQYATSVDNLDSFNYFDGTFEKTDYYSYVLLVPSTGEGFAVAPNAQITGAELVKSEINEYGEAKVYFKVTVNEDAAAISDMNLSLTLPEDGDTYFVPEVTTTDTNYTISSAGWLDSEGEVPNKFEEGKTYYLDLLVKPVMGNIFGNTVNAKLNVEAPVQANVEAIQNFYKVKVPVTVKGETPAEELKITTAKLANGTVGKAYSQKLTANYNGAFWSISEGELPYGLELNRNDGTISGTPEEKGSYTFTVLAQIPETTLNNAEKEFTITITDKTPSGGGASGTVSFVLTYNTNGGSEIKAESHKVGDEVTLDKTPVKDGYTFTGWYADKECTQKIESVTMNSSKTVYAGWSDGTQPVKPDENAPLMVITIGDTKYQLNG